MIVFVVSVFLAEETEDRRPGTICSVFRLRSSFRQVGRSGDA